MKDAYDQRSWRGVEAWHRRWKLTENVVYLLGQALQRGVPLPRKASAELSLQFLVAGQKP